VALLGAGEVRARAAALGVRPTKQLGQNFVHDANTVRRIVALAGVKSGDRVLEVGPGLGSLTLGLLEAGASVVAVEVDPVLAGGLRDTDGLDVVEADAVHHDPAMLPGEPPVRLVANLPYNVSVPVLLRCLEVLPTLRTALVMVQAEVGERMAAGPGSKAYGVPSVKLAWWGAAQVVGRVPRSVFWPVPNVDSVLVAVTRQTPPGDDALRHKVFSLVDAAFGQRRKMIRGALAAWAGSAARAEELARAAGVDPALRGEALALDSYVALARAADVPPAVIKGR
jgi:16S rRNA (adenine1518-N6/adenine1519-N6)-dimethyltransferase